MSQTDPSAPTVIAYDGSDHARAAVERAAALLAGRPAVVVSVWRSVKDVVGAALIALPASVTHDAQEKMDTAERTAAQKLADEGAELARAGGLDARGEPVEAHSSVWPAIVRAAEDLDAGVVVVGSRGRSGIKSVMLGSVSTGVVHNCRRPVLVVHGPGHG